MFFQAFNFHLPNIQFDKYLSYIYIQMFFKRYNTNIFFETFVAQTFQKHFPNDLEKNI